MCFIYFNWQYRLIRVVAIVNQETAVYFETGYQTTRVFKLEALKAGHLISGPSVIIDNNR